MPIERKYLVKQLKKKARQDLVDIKKIELVSALEMILKQVLGKRLETGI